MMVKIRMRKFVNKVLWDKDEFYKDDELKSRVELHNYLIEQIIDLEKAIIPAKLRYFWRNKKTFLFQLFGKLIFKVAAVGTILFAAWFFGFKYDPTPVVKHPKVIYRYLESEVKDTTYIKTRIPNVQLVMIFPPDPTKDWERYKEEMHFKYETTGLPDSIAYKTRRTNPDGSQSQYWGKYQMGQSARTACGIGNMSWAEYSSNPEIQEGTFKAWIRILYRDMMPYINKYQGRYMGGHQLTASGIISMAHNVGEAPTITFLTSNGARIPSDANAAATRFLSLGGYDLTPILK